MLTRTLEIRDRGTFIPVLAIKILCENVHERFLFARAGYGINPNKWHGIILIKLATAECANDIYEWTCSRTMREGHKYIQAHFSELNDGDVIDIEYILGETKEKKVSEIFETTGDAA